MADRSRQLMIPKAKGTISEMMARIEIPKTVSVIPTMFSIDRRELNGLNQSR